MKNKIVLIPFIFDDLSGTKIRPAICLTEQIKPYDQIVVAFITSRPGLNSQTDLLIDAADQDFKETGLKVSSIVRLHRLTTVSKSLIRREIGTISTKHQAQINEKLRQLFKL